MLTGTWNIKIVYLLAEDHFPRVSLVGSASTDEETWTGLQLSLVMMIIMAMTMIMEMMVVVMMMMMVVVRRPGLGCSCWGGEGIAILGAGFPRGDSENDFLFQRMSFNRFVLTIPAPHSGWGRYEEIADENLKLDCSKIFLKTKTQPMLKFLTPNWMY